MLSHWEEISGVGKWITQTGERLSKDQTFNHRLIFRALYHALEVSESVDSFPAYVDYLESLDPVILRDRALHYLTTTTYQGMEPLEIDRLLHEVAYYLDYMMRLYVRKATEKGFSFDSAIFVEAHRLLNDPAAMQAFIVRHFRMMWHDYLGEEWERNLPMLHESVQAFTELQYRYQGRTPLDAIRTVAGRDLMAAWEHEEFGKEIIFVPSAHTGPYVSHYLDSVRQISRLVFGARLPEGTGIRSAALSRSELLVRLNALADENRLDILELLTGEEELCAQDIMQKLDLSQSAASRHLRQLVATGYLIERRRDVAKCYSLNPRRLDDTFKALRGFLRID